MSAISRRVLFGAAVLPSLPLVAWAADPYPTKFIRLVLPFPPGGGTDTLSRILGQKLSESLKQQVVIDNRPGAAGNIATSIVAKAPKDGYTLLMGFSTALVVNPAIYPDLGVDVQRELAPISLVADAQYVLAVSPSVPVKSVAELIAYAKANPDKLNYSSSGVGGPLHLAGAMFASRAEVDITHLPFKGGGPAVNAVLANEAQLVFGSVAATLPYIQSDRLRALAVTSLKRSAVLPDLPTMAEAGLPGFNVTTWYGVLAPAGTPSPVIDRLNAEILKALDQADLRQNMSREGLTPIGSTPAEFAAYIAQETTAWAVVIKQANIKAD